jgi:Glyoxalase-like domain
MPVRFQIVIDCTDPDLLARFWGAALGYELEPPPAGFSTWDDYYRDVGVPEEELGIGVQVIRHRGGVDSRLDPPVPGLPLVRLHVTTNIGRVHLRHPGVQHRARRWPSNRRRR